MFGYVLLTVRRLDSKCLLLYKFNYIAVVIILLHICNYTIRVLMGVLCLVWSRQTHESKLQHCGVHRNSLSIKYKV